MDERNAIAALKRGDLAGLEALVRAHQTRALRAAYLIVRDRALAEDLVQAAFLRAYDRIEQFETGRPFGPWFLRSVVHDALKAAARQARHVPLDGGSALDGAGAPAGDGLGAEAGATLADLLADPAPGPESQAEAAELRAAVWRALGALSPAQRAAVVQRYYLDMSEAEMSAEQGRSPGTIKWRLHTARQRLRSLLWPALPQAANGHRYPPSGETEERHG